MARPDDDLIRTLPGRRGDAALRALYRLHAPALLSYAHARLGDRGLAEEAVQDVFTRVWRHAADFDPKLGSARTWIYGIARNAVADAVRRRAVRPPLARHEPRGDEQGEEPIETAMLRWQVRASMAALSPEHREIIRMARFEGLSVAEMAERTGLPPGTVKSRLWYALRALRLALEESGALT